MSKQRVLSGREVCRILSRNGFEEVRRKGSHIQMQARIRLMFGMRTTITVTVPDHRELCPGTLAAIIRRSQLDPDLFA